MDFNLNTLRKAAVEIAGIGGDSTLNFFKQSFDLEFKKDDSPVTNADRNAEMLMREAIKNRFPDHGIIGEEFGRERDDASVVWVLDPIDGTQSFIHGVPFYTTLIGILIGGKPEVGVIYAPALNEMVSAATGTGCYLNREKATIRPCEKLSEATFLTTDMEHVYKHGYIKQFEKLLSETRIHRTWGDAYGHMMVATGRADIMFDPILNLWDAAALLPVVKEAGGSYFDVEGNESVTSGSAISTNPALKSSILSFFE
ncbi:histidinol-phosphatase [Rhodohalobacter sp. 8-1]|uniref:histidinol-phosphatase n=1 Tax=Rhodohalobacter sp. 8-1 TaxID=3131972 RepID=UPI0030ED293F